MTLADPIYEERCNIAYQNKYVPLRVASNIDLGHVYFYNDHMLISFMGNTKIPYDEISLKIKEKFMLIFGQYFVLTRAGSRVKIIIKPKNFSQMKKVFLEQLSDIST